MNADPENIYFPLDDVEIQLVDNPKQIASPVVENSWMSINEHEFRMQVEQVGEFYAGYGKLVQYSVHPDATTSSIELYLNGSVFGAILHQRKILPIHGSSFIFNGKGVMLCGESGAGKSSLTTAFCLSGSEFLTDDVTPFEFAENKPFIIPRSDRVKLWSDSLDHFSESKTVLQKIRPEDEKYYFPIKQSSRERYPLSHVIIIKLKEGGVTEFKPVIKADAFAALHNEIYRLHYLSAMPSLKQYYLMQIASICNNCEVTVVLRPKNIEISNMQARLSEFLS
ncbi:MAG: hypothetical protein EA391_11465 [Balneolaceae bacterium]|nr:MAG: hypothetical protein EA391_11465 [Balneolaceae bacterium]